MMTALLDDREVAEASADPGSLATERLEAQIVGRAAQMSAAMCRWLLLVAEYDRRHAFEAWEMPSCAHWLSWRCQVTPVTAREYVRVARALAGLPIVQTEFGLGTLSYSKVRVLTRVATPDTERELLELARDLSAVQLERTARLLEQAMRPRTIEELDDIEDRRGLDRTRSGDGIVTYVLKVTEDEDEMLQRAMEHVRDRDFEAHRAAARDKSEEEAGKGSAPNEAKPAGRYQRMPRVDAFVGAVALGFEVAVNTYAFIPDRYLTVLQVDDEGFVGDDGWCISRAASGCIRRWRDGSAVAAVFSSRSATRTSPTRCRWDARPGCSPRPRSSPSRGGTRAACSPTCDVPTRWCEFHHVVRWTDGGPTDIENGLAACRRHHRAVHEGGWRMFADAAGRIIAIGPDGRRMTQAPPLPAVAPDFDLPRWYDELGVQVRRDYNPHNCRDRGLVREIVNTICHNIEVGARTPEHYRPSLR